jgi:hypothetical protein
MFGTLERMPKGSDQVRIPSSLVADLRIIAPALGETVPSYVARVLREAAKRDYPKALKKISERADKVGE